MHMSIDKKHLHCTAAANLEYGHLLCKSGFEMVFTTKLLDCFDPGFDLFNAFKCVHSHRHTPYFCSSF